MVERDFTPSGRMKLGSAKERKATKGALPFYSVDTRAEADALIEAALAAGEFVRQADGTLVETRLVFEQTIENLNAAGEALAELHARLDLPGV